LNKALDAPGLVDLVGGRTGSDRFVVQALRMAQEALGAKADDSDMDEHLKRFTSNGEVDLDGITIGGNLDCNGGHFINSGGRSLSVANGKIAGSVMCSVGLNSAFQAVGEVHLHGVKIDYDLLCIGSQVFESTDRLIAPTQEQTAGEVAGPEFMQRSLNVENAEIKGSIIIGPAFLEGEVRLAGARIGNDLLCNGTFINPGKDAVDATAVRVGGVVAFGRRFSSGFMTNITLSMVAGSLRFLRCSIEGDLRMDVSFGRRSEGILAQSARISGRVLLGIKQDSNQVIVNLRDARLGSLILDVLVA
jgi:hypothetical protein